LSETADKEAEFKTCGLAPHDRDAANSKHGGESIYIPQKGSEP
jgi:hypothetical protein